MAYVYTQRVYVSHKNCLKVHANITINVNNQNQLGVHVFGCLFMLICIYTSIPSLYRLVEPGPNCLVALQERFFGLQCQGHATVVNMCTKNTPFSARRCGRLPHGCRIFAERWRTSKPSCWSSLMMVLMRRGTICWEMWGTHGETVN